MSYGLSYRLPLKMAGYKKLFVNRKMKTTCVFMTMKSNGQNYKVLYTERKWN